MIKELIITPEKEEKLERLSIFNLFIRNLNFKIQNLDFSEIVSVYQNY